MYLVCHSVPDTCQRSADNKTTPIGDFWWEETAFLAEAFTNSERTRETRFLRYILCTKTDMDTTKRMRELWADDSTEVEEPISGEDMWQTSYHLGPHLKVRHSLMHKQM